MLSHGEGSLGQRYRETLSSVYDMHACVYTVLCIRHLPLTDVLGQSGGLLRVISQQSLIARERLHQPHVVGQRHGLFHPHTLVPVMHKKKTCMSTSIIVMDSKLKMGFAEETNHFGVNKEKPAVTHHSLSG